MSDFTVLEITGDTITMGVSEEAPFAVEVTEEAAVAIEVTEEDVFSIAVTEASPVEVGITEDSPIVLEFPAQVVNVTTGGNTVVKTAGEALGGHRAVYCASDGKAYYADHQVPLGLHRTLGITTGAAEAGALAIIQTHGALTEPSWSWTVGVPVYLGRNGLLTQACPTSGFIQEVGFPLSSTTLFIGIMPLIVTGG